MGGLLGDGRQWTQLQQLWPKPCIQTSHGSETSGRVSVAGDSDFYFLERNYDKWCEFAGHLQNPGMYSLILFHSFYHVQKCKQGLNSGSYITCWHIQSNWKQVYSGSQQHWCEKSTGGRRASPRGAGLPNSWRVRYSYDHVQREDKEWGNGRIEGGRGERSRGDRGRKQQICVCIRLPW